MPRPEPSYEIPLYGISQTQNYDSGRNREQKQSTIALQELSEDSDSGKMESRRSSHFRKHNGKSQEPLLSRHDDNEDEERGRSGFKDITPNRRYSNLSTDSNIRSSSPDTSTKVQIQTKYKYAAFFLILSLISFVVQTESAVYVQHELGWNKAYCMLYFTHASWCLLLPLQILILRIQQWNMPWKLFWRNTIHNIRTTAQTVETQQPIVSRTQHSPIPYLIRTTALITCALTVAGGSWYVAIGMTSPSDLTAIYNCSAFFAYAFSIPMLGEKFRLDKTLAVGLAIVGVLIVAYGDTAPTKNGGKSGETIGDGGNGVEKEANNRIAGNLIIGIGSVLYGFYEVIYKRLACPPEGTSAAKSMIFANTFGSLIGIFTLTILWIPLPILHIIGLEKFELPHGNTALLLAISVLANAIFSSSFLVLISLTSPVLSSVAALLTIFLVAIVDWFWTGVPLSLAAISGGILIIVAFLVLSWSTYREKSDEKP